MWNTLSDLSFTAVKISSTYHQYLQFYLSVLYILSSQESGSLWIFTIYSFICDCSVLAYIQCICNIYKPRLAIADHALTHADHVTTAA
jgi:hypothetical protein